MKSSARYVAEPSNVREVSVRGTADLQYWKDHLAAEDLAPAECDGRAQVLIVAASMKFMGIHFTEVSFSVLLTNPISGMQQPAVFLVQAFNSCRPFAFCERVLFATPYLHGSCTVSVAAPVSFQLKIGGQFACRAEMQGDTLGASRQPSRTGEEEWEGIVFLPRGRRREGRLFFGRMRGCARAFRFIPTEDRFEIAPLPDTARLQGFVESKFTADEWLVRDSATHGKSKTYRRSNVRA